jgi:hypothetical protein
MISNSNSMAAASLAPAATSEYFIQKNMGLENDHWF